MFFTTLNLSGERVLVKGTDSQGTMGQTVVDSSEWTEVKRRSEHSEAHENFEAAVEDFFKPLTEAAEKLQLQFNQVELDPISYVTLEEGEEASSGKEEVVIKLSPDSVILRILESGDHSRLVWVGDTLEVLAVLPNTGTPVAVGNGDPHANEGDDATS